MCAGQTYDASSEMKTIASWYATASLVAEPEGISVASRAPHTTAEGCSVDDQWVSSKSRLWAAAALASAPSCAEPGLPLPQTTLASPMPSTSRRSCATNGTPVPPATQPKKSTSVR